MEMFSCFYHKVQPDYEAFLSCNWIELNFELAKIVRIVRIVWTGA